MSSHDCIPGFAREVLDLFAGPLAEVRFPDLDGKVLTRHAAAVQAAQLEVTRIEEELAQARARVADEAQALMGVAQRALAYARIYADGQPELESRVAAVCERKPSAPAETSRKRTRQKSRETDTGLFDLDAASEDSAQLM